MKIIILLFTLAMLGCSGPERQARAKVWWKTVYKLCKSTCPNNTFRYRAKQFAGIHAHFYKCYCYPQFGAPKVTRIDHIIIREDIKRQNARLYKE